MIVPDQPGECKVEISEPDQLAPVFLHSHGPLDPAGQVVCDRHPPLASLIAADGPLMLRQTEPELVRDSPQRPSELEWQAWCFKSKTASE